MAKISDVSITINAKISVSDETVEACLTLIEMWLNEDKTRAIRGGARQDDGRVEPLKICKRNGKQEGRQWMNT